MADIAEPTRMTQSGQAAVHFYWPENSLNLVDLFWMECAFENKTRRMSHMRLLGIRKLRATTEAAMTIGYHDGHRILQDKFESRKIADRLDELARKSFSEDDKAFVESCAFFFLATADSEGQPDCSHKGGLPGFVRVSGPSEIVFPDYDGNGMFKSLGNIAVNPNVGLLFIDFEKPRRLRITGTASFSHDEELLQQTVGAQLMVRVKARAIFPNCPRYIPTMQFVEPSKYAPRQGVLFPEPEWKSFPDFAPVVHPRQKTFTG